MSNDKSKTNSKNDLISLRQEFHEVMDPLHGFYMSNSTYDQVGATFCDQCYAYLAEQMKKNGRYNKEEQDALDNTVNINRDMVIAPVKGNPNALRPSNRVSKAHATYMDEADLTLAIAIVKDLCRKDGIKAARQMISRWFKKRMKIIKHYAPTNQTLSVPSPVKPSIIKTGNSNQEHLNHWLKHIESFIASVNDDVIYGNYDFSEKSPNSNRITGLGNALREFAYNHHLSVQFIFITNDNKLPAEDPQNLTFKLSSIGEKITTKVRWDKTSKTIIFKHKELAQKLEQKSAINITSDDIQQILQNPLTLFLEIKRLLPKIQTLAKKKPELASQIHEELEILCKAQGLDQGNEGNEKSAETLLFHNNTNQHKIKNTHRTKRQKKLDYENAKRNKDSQAGNTNRSTNITLSNQPQSNGSNTPSRPTPKPKNKKPVSNKKSGANPGISKQVQISYQKLARHKLKEAKKQRLMENNKLVSLSTPINQNTHTQKTPSPTKPKKPGNKTDITNSKNNNTGKKPDKPNTPVLSAAKTVDKKLKNLPTDQLHQEINALFSEYIKAPDHNVTKVLCKHLERLKNTKQRLYFSNIGALCLKIGLYGKQQKDVSTSNTAKDQLRMLDFLMAKYTPKDIALPNIINRALSQALSYKEAESSNFAFASIVAKHYGNTQQQWLFAWLETAQECQKSPHKTETQQKFEKLNIEAKEKGYHLEKIAPYNMTPALVALHYSYEKQALALINAQPKKQSTNTQQKNTAKNCINPFSVGKRTPKLPKFSDVIAKLNKYSPNDNVKKLRSLCTDHLYMEEPEELSEVNAEFFASLPVETFVEFLCTYPYLSDPEINFPPIAEQIEKIQYYLDNAKTHKFSLLTKLSGTQFIQLCQNIHLYFTIDCEIGEDTDTTRHNSDDDKSNDSSDSDHDIVKLNEAQSKTLITLLEKLSQHASKNTLNFNQTECYNALGVFIASCELDQLEDAPILLKTHCKTIQSALSNATHTTINALSTNQMTTYEIVLTPLTRLSEKSCKDPQIEQAITEMLRTLVPNIFRSNDLAYTKQNITELNLPTQKDNLIRLCKTHGETLEKRTERLAAILKNNIEKHKPIPQILIKKYIDHLNHKTDKATILIKLMAQSLATPCIINTTEIVAAIYRHTKVNDAHTANIIQQILNRIDVLLDKNEKHQLTPLECKILPIYTKLIHSIKKECKKQNMELQKVFPKKAIEKLYQRSLALIETTDTIHSLMSPSIEIALRCALLIENSPEKRQYLKILHAFQQHDHIIIKTANSRNMHWFSSQVKAAALLGTERELIRLCCETVLQQISHAPSFFFRNDIYFDKPLLLLALELGFKCSALRILSSLAGMDTQVLPEEFVPTQITRKPNASTWHAINMVCQEAGLYLQNKPDQWVIQKANCLLTIENLLFYSPPTAESFYDKHHLSPLRQLLMRASKPRIKILDNSISEFKNIEKFKFNAKPVLDEQGMCITYYKSSFVIGYLRNDSSNKHAEVYSIPRVKTKETKAKRLHPAENSKFTINADIDKEIKLLCEKLTNHIDPNFSTTELKLCTLLRQLNEKRRCTNSPTILPRIAKEIAAFVEILLQQTPLPFLIDEFNFIHEFTDLKTFKILCRNQEIYKDPLRCIYIIQNKDLLHKDIRNHVVSACVDTLPEAKLNNIKEPQVTEKTKI